MKVLHKDVFREIKNSTGRFVSLFLIVVLGVAFYAGIRSCNPDMLISADSFYDQSNLADIRVMSTLGITDEDVKKIAEVDGVESAFGAYSYDFLCKLDETQYVVKLLGLTEGINDIVLKSGTIPKNTHECLVDNYYMNMRGYKIGDKIELLPGDDSKLEDVVSESTFEIVGSFVSSAYLSMSMGTSSIGSGKVEGLMVVLPEVFTLDVYTEADILVDGAKDMMCYSDEYTDLVDVVIDNIKEISDERVDIRYEQVIDEANQKLADAKVEFEDGKQKYADAKKEFEDGKQKLEDAKKAYEDGKNQLEQSKVDLENGWSQLNSAKAQLSEAESSFSILKTAGEAEIELLQEQYAYVEDYVKNNIKPATRKAIIAYIYSVTGYYVDLDDYKALTDVLISDTQRRINEGQAEIDNARWQISENEALLYNGQWQIEQGEIELENARKEIEDGEKELADAEKELKDGEQELKDAEDALDDAEKKIAKMEKTQWYVLSRNYLTEYSSFKSDAERIGNIGKVFPIIFFIVAALVCLTTMTRMVDEERTQIGTLKALGYGKGEIMRKYIVYALLATVTGSIVGALAGSKILPYIILNVYKLLYPNIENLMFPYNLEHCLVASFAALGCILAATLFACTKSLMEVPASLMRPVSPKIARKLILERIPSVWGKIKFTWKNAFRNFVRYKKRLFMTLFGICGSTALLLVGFGLKDAINTILYAQYGDICLYNEIISIDQDASEKDKKELNDKLIKDNRFDSYLYSYETVVDTESDNSEEILTAYIYVPEDAEAMDKNIILRDRVSREEYSLNDDEVMISEKMATTLNVKAGDEITVSVNQKDQRTLKVGHVVENYIYHYIYMTPTMYKTLYDEEPDYNAITIVNKQGVTIDPDEFGKEFLAYDAVGGVSCISTLIDKFSDMLGSLDSITLVLIVCAGALTFVVLYNLNNINISERRRELATLKVLGFYDIELSQYIYRENILITIIGIALGVVGGIFLNKFVVTTVEVDIVMFGRQIFAMSFVKSILIAIAFTVIVNIIVHFKLKKIDMATSLKSVE